MKKDKIQVMILILIFLLISIGYPLFSVVLSDYSYFKYIKEILILFLFISIIIDKNGTIISILKREKKVKIEPIDYCIIIFIGMLMVSFIFFTANKLASIYIIRCYVEGFFIYVIARNIHWSSSDLRYFNHKMFDLYFVLSLYGIFQAYILKDKFLINIGYPQKNGHLTYPFYISGFGNLQRVCSTFVNPNTFAFFTALFILYVFINRDLFKEIKYKNLKLMIIIIAFLLTYSKSNILAFIICLFAYIILNAKNFKLSKNAVLTFIFSIILLFVIGLFFDIKLIGNLLKLFERTITLKDTSAAGRPKIWLSAFNRFKNNIFGIGLGMTGSKAVYIGNKMLEASESSYFCIALDSGIQGLISYISIFISIFIFSYKHRQKIINKYLRKVNSSLVFLTIYVMVAFAFSNYVQDFELMSIYFCLVGIIMNLIITYGSDINEF